MFPTLPKGKSGTREVGMALLLLWAFASAYLFFWIPGGDVTNYINIYSTLTTACVGFAFGAFGITKVMDSGAFAAKPARQRRAADKGELL